MRYAATRPRFAPEGLVGPPLSRAQRETRQRAPYQAVARDAAENRRTAGLFPRALSYSGANGMGAHPHDSSAGPAGGRLGADLASHVEAIVRAAEREARAAERAIADQRRSAEQEVRRYLAAARLHADAEAAARAARLETLSAAARRLSDELSDAVRALAHELDRSDERIEADAPRAPWPTPEPAAQAPPATTEPTAPEPTWSRIEEPTDSAHADRAGAGNADRQHVEHATADRAGGGEDARPPADRPVGAHPEPTGPARSSAEPEEEGPDTSKANGEPPVPSAARLVAIEMAVGGSSRAEVEEHLRTRLSVADPQPLLDDVFGTASHAGSRLAWGEP
jgi:hypothetical protein